MKISVPTLILTRSNNYNNKNKNSTLGSILCGVSSTVVNPDLFRIRKPDLFRIRIHATTTFGSKKKFRIQPGLDPTPIILNMLESIKKCLLINKKEEKTTAITLKVHSTIFCVKFYQKRSEISIILLFISFMLDPDPRKGSRPGFTTLVSRIKKFRTFLKL